MIWAGLVIKDLSQAGQSLGSEQFQKGPSLQSPESWQAEVDEGLTSVRARKAAPFWPPQMPFPRQHS